MTNFSKVTIRILGRWDKQTCEVRNIIRTERKILGVPEELLYFEAKGVYPDEPESWTGMYTLRGKAKIEKFLSGEEVFLLGGMSKVQIVE